MGRISVTRATCCCRGGTRSGPRRSPGPRCCSTGLTLTTTKLTVRRPRLAVRRLVQSVSLAVGGHLSHSLSSVVLEGIVFRPYFGYPGVPAVVHADVGPVVEALSLVAARLDALVLVGLGVFVEDFLDKVVDDGLLDVVLIGLNYRSDLVSLDGR
jgi:hypothetical protein